MGTRIANDILIPFLLLVLIFVFIILTILSHSKYPRTEDFPVHCLPAEFSADCIDEK